ncbi:hypothetical protein [Novipirellula rosea]|uniref:Uncharacterized protein n=1 Tax=Novipirellula rosea TaxID=1031540 RepID=A0ABP8MAB3_9BACT
MDSDPLEEAATLVEALLADSDVLPEYDRETLTESCRELELSLALGSLSEPLSDLLAECDTDFDVDCESESLDKDPLRLLADASQLCDGEVWESESEWLSDSLSETLDTDSLAVEFDAESELLSDVMLPESLD